MLHRGNTISSTRFPRHKGGDRRAKRRLRGLLLALLLGLAAPPAAAFEPAVLDSVVSLLPAWPGYPRGGGTAPPGAAPEGSAVAIAPNGYLATALHVVARATSLEVRLADGRRLPAELVAGDAASDLALLKVEAELPVLAPAPEPGLGQPVCAVGNAFGLGLSVTCGVVSALARSDVGFNRVEDFVQTDAAVNPGASGGALVDEAGRLVGLLSAIFTKDSDANIGVNFAVSQALLARVMDDLIAYGRVRRPAFGLVAGEPEDRSRPGVTVSEVAAAGAAAAAGLAPGDRLLAVAGRPVDSLGAVAAALALQAPGARVALVIEREGQRRELTMRAPAE